MDEKGNKHYKIKCASTEILENEELMEKLEEYIMSNAFDYKIAEALGISRMTYYTLKKHPKIKEIYQKKIEIMPQIIENSLFNKATGYNIEVEVMTPTGIQKINKWYEPDTAANVIMQKKFNKDFTQKDFFDRRKAELDIQIKEQELEIKRKINNGEINIIDNVLLSKITEKIEDLKNNVKNEKEK